MAISTEEWKRCRDMQRNSKTVFLIKRWSQGCAVKYHGLSWLRPEPYCNISIVLLCILSVSVWELFYLSEDLWSNWQVWVMRIGWLSVTSPLLIGRPGGLAVFNILSDRKRQESLRSEMLRLSSLSTFACFELLWSVTAWSEFVLELVSK